MTLIDKESARSPSSDAQQIERAQEVVRRLSLANNYPRAPRLIEYSWSALVPVIVELSYHHSDEQLTLIQSLRKTYRSITRSARIKNKPAAFKNSLSVLDTWLYDVLILLGTLPIEATEISPTMQKQSLARYTTGERGDATAAMSAQSRSEAMCCIELLCNRVWYDRHIRKEDEIGIYTRLFGNLQYLYWECGVPTDVTLLTDLPPDLDDPIYEEVRVLNYRQLYAIHKKRELHTLLANVNTGVEILRDRRIHEPRVFERSLKNDPRWDRSFPATAELIKQKYEVSDES